MQLYLTPPPLPRVLLALLLLALCLIKAQAQHHDRLLQVQGQKRQIMINGGLGLASQMFTSTITPLNFEEGNTNRRLVFNVGAQLNYRISKRLDIAGGLGYRQRGHVQQARIYNSQTGITEKHRFSLVHHFVGLDAIARAYFSRQPQSFYLLGGARLDALAANSYNVTRQDKDSPSDAAAEQNLTDVYAGVIKDYNRILPGMVLGLGYRTRLLSAEVYWNPDLGPAYRQSEFNRPLEIRNTVVGLQVNYVIRQW